MHSVPAGLTSREAKGVRRRLVIDMTTDHSPVEVGNHFDVTREHVRQIEAEDIRAFPSDD